MNPKSDAELCADFRAAHMRYEAIKGDIERLEKKRDEAREDAERCFLTIRIALGTLD